MILSRLLTVFALVAGLSAAAPALAGSNGGLAGGASVSHPGLPLDPELLPANSGPGDCVTRRMTGPGGAYRWDRVECDRQQSAVEQGWSSHDQWGYGRQIEVIKTEARGAPPAGYDCDRCRPAAPVIADPCDPCAAAAQAYGDRRVNDYSRAQSQGYQSGYTSGYQAHFQGGYDTVCIQGCGGSAARAYAQDEGQYGGQTLCDRGCGGYAQQSYTRQTYARRAEGDRYGPGPGYGAENTDYDVAGRDTLGYLVWPGKRP